MGRAGVKANNEWGVANRERFPFAIPYSLTLIVAPSTQGANSAPPKSKLSLLVDWPDAVFRLTPQFQIEARALARTRRLQSVQRLGDMVLRGWGDMVRMTGDASTSEAGLVKCTVTVTPVSRRTHRNSVSAFHAARESM
jgi:hypothetical protein